MAAQPIGGVGKTQYNPEMEEFEFALIKTAFDQADDAIYISDSSFRQNGAGKG